jgi:NAD(P)-dependent dehydrogenase (short-subunit alcohol dehydrogenase family)
MTEVQGRTALITGGANGIGLGIARAFGRAGAKLALADIDAAALERAREELQQISQVETYVLDVRDRAAYAAVAGAVERTLGPVSLLFNNAGVAAGAPAAKMSFELWDWAMGINLGGVINGVQTFLPGMIERGQGGHVVNTASGAGLVAATTMLYTTAKYGVVGMSESLSMELTKAGTGIGVSVLCPGPVATDIVNRTANAQPKGGPALSEEQLKKVAAGQARATARLAQGVSIDAVGEMVLKAVRENRLYIHTDRALEGAIKARAQALLDALPPG